MPDCFAITAPGLEPITARELEALSIVPRIEAGGVSWKGGMGSISLSNLWLRSASRVVVRIGEFKARTFFEMERQAAKLPWREYVRKGATVDFRVTCRKSKLYHSGAVAQRLATAAAAATGAVRVEGATSTDDDEPESAAQLFIVRVVNDVCTVSIDTSGELLHRRGYRQAVAKAPLRETLAAAVLLGAGWTGDSALVDPMCGSGTIPIEGAMIARRMAPGANRAFAFFDWPAHDATAWRTLVARAQAGVLGRSPVRIVGSDRDAGAIAASVANAERAGVSGDIQFVEKALSAVERVAETGLLAVNPPYGVRTGDPKVIRNLYSQIGNVARRDLGGWKVALLSPDARLAGELKLPLTEAFATSNGGIPVRLMTGDVL